MPLVQEWGGGVAGWEVVTVLRAPVFTFVYPHALQGTLAAFCQMETVIPAPRAGEGYRRCSQGSARSRVQQGVWVLRKRVLNWNLGKRDVVVEISWNWKQALYSDERPSVC